ncbi:MAG: ArsB/NhaD family transporter [Alphaproteobacteria bacterium]|nr:ArsB/NhaD family transporter [Alphaproteobacteria bacterium]MBQ8630925.1 ArsB/NhaD family transporter [Alphaproteobacteria bacterium]
MDAKVLATVIVIIAYVILFTEKVNRAIVALLAASVMIFSGILTQTTALKGIDFNTLALLIGMMTIVGISERSGMFQYVAVWGAKKVHANPRGLLVVLAVVTAVFSAFLDNVTTVLLIAPVTFQITRKLKINPYPYLILEIFASNIGGTATLIGDPPNILIGSALNLSFTDFLNELTPVVTVTMLVLILGFDMIWGKRLTTTEKNKQTVMKINEIDCITDWKLLHKSLLVLALVILGFISAEHLHIANGTIAMFGAAALLLLYTLGDSHDKRDHKVEEIFGVVDWTTIFFFSGLFVIVYGLEVTGVLGMLGQKFVELTEGSIEKSAMLIIWVSAIVSSAIDNIPFVATMIPMIKSMEESMGGREAMMPVWWALSLGACFGGNGTLIGASANVIVAGMAQREGHPISFLGFMLWSVPVMLISVAIAALYLHIRFFM